MSYPDFWAAMRGLAARNGADQVDAPSEREWFDALLEEEGF
ncbi:hypothetical protein EDE12_106141 [Methylosinus sp. sav-2]|nr:hypothetical protein [Methylosinus sp. sav-2]TDX63996.1 hypothetical protein EDE12_106141 [Methylosinus sp. sav-2]